VAAAAPAPALRAKGSSAFEPMPAVLERAAVVTEGRAAVAFVPEPPLPEPPLMVVWEECKKLVQLLSVTAAAGGESKKKQQNNTNRVSPQPNAQCTRVPKDQKGCSCLLCLPCRPAPPSPWCGCLSAA
jgi:hypothetical protein